MRIRSLLILLAIFFFINNSYSLECTPDGMVTGVEIALDDNSFSSDFDGTSGIIYKLNYNTDLGKYELWRTDNLPKRNDMGDNIASYSGPNPAENLVDSSNLGDVLEIDTSQYKDIYVKETLKNTGSCEDYRYQTLKHYSRIIDIGGTTTNFYLREFGSRVMYIDVNSEDVEYHSMDIEDFYSGDVRVRSWIRKGSNPYSPTFQLFEIKFYFNGPNIEVPQVSRVDSYSNNPLVEGANHYMRYEFHNPSSTQQKNISFKFQTWSGDANPHLNIYSSYKENTMSDKITLAPLETRTIRYDYTIPYERDQIGLNSYRASEYILYVDDPILGSRYLLRSWPGIGSLNHSYLTPDIQKETFVQGTTNEGIPYVGTDYLLKEYNLRNSIGVDPGDYDYEIIAYKENTSHSWTPFHTIRDSFDESLGVNENKRQSFIYPLYDFENWVDHSIRVDMNGYWNAKDWRFFYDTTSRGNFNIDLDFSHLLMSTDMPVYIYPNGGSSTAFIRDILFNLKDYSLRGVNITSKVIDPNTGSVSSDFSVSNPTNFDLPAQASYPVPIEVSYNGAIEDKRYLLEIEYKYYDEINDITKEKKIYGDIYIRDDAVSSGYYDIVPTTIDFDNLYMGKETQISINLENQGDTALPSSHKVSLYHKKLDDPSFTLLESKTVASTQNKVDFLYTPAEVDSMIFKVVVDEDDVITEDSLYTPLGEKNNALSSIAYVRNIDMVLKRAIPIYDDISEQGIIPFEIEVYNKETGGVDEFTIDLNISWRGEFWYFNETFYNIPQEGRNFTYYWDVSDVTPGVHMYSASVTPRYDSDFSDNEKRGPMDFCPLPWEGSSILDCFNTCESTCIDTITKRYMASCDNTAGCNFYNSTIAKKCDGGFKDTYIDFNSTHEALCPDASKRELKKVTDDKLVITGDCKNIITKDRPVLFRGESVNLKLIECISD